jgi:hypothetical protein
MIQVAAACFKDKVFQAVDRDFLARSATHTQLRSNDDDERATEELGGAYIFSNTSYYSQWGAIFLIK